MIHSIGKVCSLDIRRVLFYGGTRILVHGYPRDTLDLKDAMTWFLSTARKAARQRNWVYARHLMGQYVYAKQRSAAREAVRNIIDEKETNDRQTDEHL